MLPPCCDAASFGAAHSLSLTPCPDLHALPACNDCRTGVVVECESEGKEPVLALLEAGMLPLWEGYLWRRSARDGRVFADRTAGDSGGGKAVRRPALHVLAADWCLGNGELPGFIAVALGDGCPANCLASNLELQPQAGREQEWQQFRQQLLQERLAQQAISAAAHQAQQQQQQAAAAAGSSRSVSSRPPPQLEPAA